MEAAFKIVGTQSDSTARMAESVLPVPLWSYSLDIGPALLNFYQYCLGKCRREAKDAFETSYGELMQDFSAVGERAIKRWIEDLREPLDDDQPDTAYERLGLLRLNKARLTGRFTIEPLPPADRGPRADPTRPSPQRRFWRSDQPQTCARKSAEEAREPQTYAHKSAEGGQTQTCAHKSAVDHEPAETLARLQDALRELAGAETYRRVFGPPVEWSATPEGVRAESPDHLAALAFRKMYRSVIGPACRRAFPRGGSCQIFLAEPSGPAENGDGRDRPQTCAHKSAVLFLKLSSLGTLKESLGNELEVQGKAAVLAAAQELAGRFADVPPHFYRWQWVQTAWSVTTGRIARRDLDDVVRECLRARKPAWAFASRVKRLFEGHGVRWLDASKANDKAELAARLAKVGLAWDEAWEGAARKPR